MVERQTIKGDYLFDVNIYTMFSTYNVRIFNTNMITRNGISFFLNKCISPPIVTDGEVVDEDGYIGYIGVGLSTVSPSQDDSKLIDETNIFYNNDVNIDNNKIILSVETTGDIISGTNEIGVYTTKNLLISRDVHDTYHLPSTSSVKITYTYTLNQTDYSETDY